MHNLKSIYAGSLTGQVCFHCRRYASTKTHYDVLGVSKSASKKEIKSAYIDLSKKHHPDTAGPASKKRFTEINEAYSVLSKPLSRKEYDNKLAYESMQGTSSSNTFHGQHHRRPGAGYPPPYSGYQQRDQGYNQWGGRQSSEYNPYSDYQRQRYEQYSELRRRYEYFYGPKGKENRAKAKQSAAGFKSQEAQDKEFIRVLYICITLALISTFFRMTGFGFASSNRASNIRSPSADIKAEIDRSVSPQVNLAEKDITPPRM